MSPRLTGLRTGVSFAIIRQVQGSSRLEYPIGTVLAESKGYLSDVRISPKGDLIAFMYHAFEWDNRGPVVVVDRSGTVVAKSPEYSWEEGLAWTADGAAVLFGGVGPGCQSLGPRTHHGWDDQGCVMSDPPRLMVYPTGAGEPRDISVAGFASYDYVSTRFLEDGRGVAFCGSETGKASRCYVRDLAGGAARPVTPEGTDHGLVSRDGTTVVARDTDGHYQLYPLDGGEPSPVPGLDDGDYPINWRADSRSLLIYRPMEIPSRIERLDLSTGKKALIRVLAPADLVGAQAVYGVSVAANEKSYAYALERAVGALYVVEGVR